MKIMIEKIKGNKITNFITKIFSIFFLNFYLLLIIMYIMLIYMYINILYFNIAHIQTFLIFYKFSKYIGKTYKYLNKHVNYSEN